MILEINEDPGTVILVHKPLGLTSFDVTYKIKRFLQRRWRKVLPEAQAKKKKVKVGHAGTLDPLATGLLIVCVGKETKNIETYMGQDKTYTGTFVLGATTPSFDRETEVDQKYETAHITAEAIVEAAKALTGEIEQLPPAFSAIKIEGRRAYVHARAGEEPALKLRKVTIHAFEIVKVEGNVVHFEIKCSKGTYIRSIARDFGRILESGAYLGSLQRTKIGEYDLKSAFTLEEIADYFGEKVEIKEGVKIRNFGFQ